jgi:hypothetical protein
MTNDAMTSQTGDKVVSTGQKTTFSQDNLVTNLLSQAYTNTLLISLQSANTSNTGVSNNDLIIDEIIGKVVETATGDIQTGATNNS